MSVFSVGFSILSASTLFSGGEFTSRVSFRLKFHFFYSFPFFCSSYSSFLDPVLDSSTSVCTFEPLLFCVKTENC
jgi:hypothetical protein